MSLSIATATLLVVSALLVLRATLVPIRDSMDDFIADLQKQSRWASYGAVAAFGVAVLDLVARVVN
jgi:hypothetical protein